MENVAFVWQSCQISSSSVDLLPKTDEKILNLYLTVQYLIGQEKAENVKSIFSAISWNNWNFSNVHNFLSIQPKFKNFW